MHPDKLRTVGTAVGKAVGKELATVGMVGVASFQWLAPQLASPGFNLSAGWQRFLGSWQKGFRVFCAFSRVLYLLFD
jgi:hypothetical protein